MDHCDNKKKDSALRTPFHKPGTVLMPLLSVALSPVPVMQFISYRVDLYHP